MKRHGVSPARIGFVSSAPRAQYLQNYHRIDIALDTLPYNGITTTCDALWMGVPVISQVGHTACGRAGLSLLTAVGLSDLVSHRPEHFAPIAQNLASDPRRLEHLRQSLRQTMAQSPLMDAPQFAKKVESAYRDFWTHWCAK
jgi:protein O-GlcNAc transferase